ncbi:hypothetical protein PARPLA_00487 [Rhodobacteraceae bacterium THAF1]|uniref:hypothetical protein n=1 Tax=Palleronia sp. THAF1 TaxID=2587842 RepID=UPI000F3D0968|nr:hypothetical protein [Palleronia sp. THAF1]QFU09950.1 hypothetical protein FIU81_14825 [Palleronia sp. THAF1]VDC17146.1 hypothetical protein PARPLA_00487 [Rhodobacteraceae bacterium THAF1]
MNVIELGLTERAEQDTWRLLSTTQPDGGWHPDLGPGLEELAEGMSAISHAWNHGDLYLLRDRLEPLAQQAGALGLNRIARVAHTTQRLTHSDDAPALAANAARLMRLGRALFEDACRHSDQV